MNIPIRIYSNVENRTCSYYIWEGRHCAPGCSCEREELILVGGIRHRSNYGYTVPFEYEIIE